MDNTSDVVEREAIALMCGTAESLAGIMRQTKYRCVTVTVRKDGGHEIAYSVEEQHDPTR